MLQLARNFIGLLAALALMAILAAVAFVLARTNPGINIGLFFGAAGVVFTMIVLLAMHR